MGKLVRALSSDGGVLCSAVDAADIAAEVIRIHSPSPTAAVALGRLCSAGALMGALLKNEGDSLTLRIDGGGAIGAMTCVSDYMGNVKCCCGDPSADVPPRADGKINVGGLVGKDGTLTVVRDLGLKEPYVTRSPLVSGEIAEDITAYYAISEQIPTVCALGVRLGGEGEAVFAGGYIIQVVPPVNEASIDFIEKNIKNMQSVTRLFSLGKTPEDVALMGLEGLGGELLDSWDCGYKCGCGRERTAKILKGLGKKELENLIADPENNTEVCCPFCGKKYEFSKDDLKRLLAESGEG